MFNLTVEDNNGQIADRFSFDHGSYVIGRHDDCDIVLPSTSVSRQHARIFVDKGRCYIEDLGSSNGVVVDGQRVMKSRDLGTASQIKIGDFYLYLEFKRPERAAQANVLQTLFISDDSDHCKLVRINDAFAGEEFSLSEIDNTIGRTDDNFILLSDPSISRHHAKIFREGERYTMMDLGSSNGSRHNGKPLTTPTVLAPGDRVHFGNVEFVFVPGHIEINPAEYASTPGGGNLVLFVGIGVFVLLGVVAGALIVFGMTRLGNEQQPVANAPQAQTVEERAAAALAEGRSRMERRDWAGAATAFDEVLALSPQHDEAKALKTQSLAEQAAQEQFEDGESQVEQGRHRDALRTFEGIPEGTVAHTRAKDHIAHVKQTLAYNLRSEALQLSKQNKLKKKDLLDAHAKVKEALQLNPDDDDSLGLVRDIEEKLDKKKWSYEPYRP